MDDEWLEVFNRNAAKDVPEYEMSCWNAGSVPVRVSMFMAILEELEGVSSVLDVGCGPGSYCRLLAKRGYDVLGVDYAPGVVKLAQERAPQLRFEQANGYNLPFPNQGFDLVISIGALQCLKDYRRFVAELCRVSGKWVVLSTLRNLKKADPEETLKKLLAHDSWPTRTFHPDDLIPLFAQAGFEAEAVFEKNGERIPDEMFIVGKRRGLEREG